MITSRRFREIASVWWLSAALLPLAVYLALTRGHYTILDNAHLFIHEMGHLVFAPFGAPLRMAGGTLLQVVVPLGLALYAYSYEYRIATQLFLFWLGHSFINVSVYAADAQARALPLVSLAGGGDNTMHDWYWMLEGLGLLQWDTEIGFAFWIIGLCCFVAAMVIPLRLF
jgi:hypothetical protein